MLRQRFVWKRLSLAAALVYEPDGSDAHLVFQLRPGAYNGLSLLEFLMELHQLERRRSMVLLWDGLPAHRSRCITDWIDGQGSWLSVERLPAYAPELNPTEQVFGCLKSKELANLLRHDQRGRRRSAGWPVPNRQRCRALLRVSQPRRRTHMSQMRRQLHECAPRRLKEGSMQKVEPDGSWLHQRWR